MTDRKEVAARIAEQAAGCGVEIVASLPDNWMSEVIRTFDADDRFRHVPVNREESAVGLCSGAFLSGTGSLAVMGASGLMTLIYAITKINYTYEIPMTILATLRGAPGDRAKFHVSNGLYFLPSLDAISLTYTVIDSADKIPEIGRLYHHARTVSRPTVAILTRDVLREEA